MGIWWLMLIMILAVPLLMIWSGVLLIRKDPKKPGNIPGFHSERAMQTEETQLFANKYCGTRCVVYGMALIAVCIVWHSLVRQHSTMTVITSDAIIILVQTVFFINAVLATEDALKKHFYDDGSHREESGEK